MGKAYADFSKKRLEKKPSRQTPKHYGVRPDVGKVRDIVRI